MTGDTLPGRLSVNPAGSEKRRLYIDAVDEALQKARSDGKKHPLPRMPRRRINDIAVRQMKLVERQQRELSKTLTEYRGECGECKKRRNVPVTALPAIVSASNEISNQIERLARSIRDGAKAEREAMAGLDDSQLDAVLRSQLPRLAPLLSDHERAVLLSVWFGEDVARVLLDGASK